MSSPRTLARALARLRFRSGVAAASLGLAVPMAAGLEGSVTGSPADLLPPYTGAVAAKAVGAARVGRGVAVVLDGGATLATAPGGGPRLRLHEGAVLGVEGRSGSWLKVTTICGTTAWAHEDKVVVTPAAPRARRGPGFDLGTGVVVVDAVHGGDTDPGAVGPAGLAESVVNLDIADRLRALLLASHDVDWETGEVTDGDEIPSLAAVLLTRDPRGPLGGNYEVALAYRASLANAAGAHAFVSVHNNGGPTMPLSRPGTEVYYAVSTQESDRLGALVHEELVRSFSEFDVNWGGGSVFGAQARTDAGTGRDYYGVLRRARVPAIIVEGAYITRPDEERLLASARFRDAYAKGIYRGIVRFLTTTESGSRVHEPQPFASGAVANHSHCELPAQNDLDGRVRPANSAASASRFAKGQHGGAPSLAVWLGSALERFLAALS